MLKTVQLNIFVETATHLLQDSLMNKEFKITAFIWKYFFNITNPFNATFDQFNESLLKYSLINKNIFLTSNF